MQPGQSAQQGLRGAVRADVVTIGLAAGRPRYQERDTGERQQGGGLRPRQSVTRPAGEHGERDKLTEPQPEPAYQRQLPEAADQGSSVEAGEGHHQGADDEAPEGGRARLGGQRHASGLVAGLVVGETRLDALGDRVTRQRRARHGVDLRLAEIERRPFPGVALR